MREPTAKMNVNLGIWDKLNKLLLFLLLVAALIAVIVWYLPLIQQNERMRQEILRLELKIKEEEKNARQLQSIIDALKHDPQTVERMAREKLGYAKQGETVIYFEPVQETSSTNGISIRQ